MSSKSKKRYAKERKMMEQINEPGNNTEIEQSAQMEEDRSEFYCLPQIINRVNYRYSTNTGKSNCRSSYPSRESNPSMLFKQSSNN